MDKLLDKRCIPCEGRLSPLSSEIYIMLKEIPGWEVKKLRSEKIYRCFQFENYYQVIAFVNAIAWVAHCENHHPHLEVGYNNCVVQYWTHAINGLSENDFICAKKVNDLYSKMTSTDTMLLCESNR